MTTTLVLAVLFAAEVELDRTSTLVVDQTNAYRKQQDLPPVATNPQLQKAALYFAQFLAKQELEEDDDGLDHEADGKTPAERAADHGYEYCIVLENIAMYPVRKSYTNESLAKALALGWQGSERHRENLLDPDVTETAVAIARNAETDRYYAVQMLGRPKSARIEFTIDNKTKSEVAYAIDGQEFQLKPGVARTHTHCSPPKLVVQLGEDKEQLLKPQMDDVFAVVNREGELRVDRSNGK